MCITFLKKFLNLESMIFAEFSLTLRDFSYTINMLFS